MTLHPNAKVTPYTRRLLVERVDELGGSMAEAAQAAGVAVRTGFRWVRRWRQEGPAGLRDRRSTPHRSPRRTAPQRVERIVRWRRQRHTAAAIAQRLQRPRSTGAAVLRRVGLSRLSQLDPKPPIQR
jgi:transposase